MFLLQHRQRLTQRVLTAARCCSTKSLLDSKLACIGGGRMAEAILNALKSKNIIAMENVHVYDVNEDRLAYLKDKYKIIPCNSMNDCVSNSELIILAVKPQHVSVVAESLTIPITNSVVISIAAGVEIKQLVNKFKTKLVIRTMPNTPAMVLEGITVWTATKETPPPLLEKAKALFNTFGDEIEVSDEAYLDMATAVSGSGPAYVFLTMEAMIDASVHLGFPRETAIKLVTATIKGSAVYSQQSKDNLTTLRNNVTSPGGTTASALYELERGNFRTVIADGIWAAYRRSLELGHKNPNVGPGRNKFTKLD